jgi:hypothetical protein
MTTLTDIFLHELQVREIFKNLGNGWCRRLDRDLRQLLQHLNRICMLQLGRLEVFNLSGFNAHSINFFDILITGMGQHWQFPDHRWHRGFCQRWTPM